MSTLNFLTFWTKISLTLYGRLTNLSLFCHIAMGQSRVLTISYSTEIGRFRILSRHNLSFRMETWQKRRPTSLQTVYRKSRTNSKIKSQRRHLPARRSRMLLTHKDHQPSLDSLGCLTTQTGSMKTTETSWMAEALQVILDLKVCWTKTQEESSSKMRKRPSQKCRRTLLTQKISWR